MPYGIGYGQGKRTGAKGDSMHKIKGSTGKAKAQRFEMPTKFKRSKKGMQKKMHRFEAMAGMVKGKM